jgi:hypothetical protein
MARIQAEPGFEIQPGVLGADDIAAIKAEVSLDHETLRRTGIRNLEKKFTSIARAAAHPSVLSIAERWRSAAGPSCRDGDRGRARRA